MVRFLARVCLAGIFCIAGFRAYNEPGGRVKALPNIGMPESELAVKVNGITMAVAGTTLALGLFPKLSALALIGTLVPTTAAGHAFWKEKEEPGLSQQQTQFLKNLGLIGGLLLVLAEESKPKQPKAAKQTVAKAKAKSKKSK